MPCLFQRDFTNRKRPVLLRDVTPGCEWVLAGEGTASVKWDGTACMVQDHKLFRRYDCKHGKTPPEGFVPCGDPDSVTGHWPGWIPIDDGPECKWHREALLGIYASDGTRFRPSQVLPNGTYELCGPRVQGNPQQLPEHELVPHGQDVIRPPRDWDGLRGYLERNRSLEGIVWAHPDGRMAKLRRDDFGFSWPNKPGA
jgi:hypothetical protein